MTPAHRRLLVGTAIAPLVVVVALGPAEAAEFCNGKQATFVGTSGVDRPNMTSGQDVLVLYGGDDVVAASGGADTICAGPGNDSIEGGDGNDWVTGGDGFDRIDGGAGLDYIEGAADNDQISGNAGDDTLDGGAGHDVLKGGEDADYLRGGDGEDGLNGGPHDDRIEGGAQYDFLVGGDGNDTMNGGDGDDAMYGGNGDDTMYESRSATPQTYDTGTDYLAGGPGTADVLVFDPVNDSGYPDRAADTTCPERDAFRRIGAYNPSRLVPQQTGCLTVTGIAEMTSKNGDGDHAFNIGIYHVEIMPRDFGHLVEVPEGQRVTVTGLYARDANHDLKIEIHPVFSVSFVNAFNVPYATYLSGPQYAGSPDRIRPTPDTIGSNRYCWDELGNPCRPWRLDTGEFN